MAVLAVDCAVKYTNVGIASSGKVIAEFSEVLGREQSSALPIVTERLLRENGLSLQDISLLAVTVGPGYYTGIRVGVSYAAALAYSLNLKIAAFTTLETFISGLTDEFKDMVPVIRARDGALYCARYLSDAGGGRIQQLMQPSFMNVGKFCDMMLAAPDAVIIGEDRHCYADVVSLPNRAVDRACGSAGLLAAEAERRADRYMLPNMIRGIYLRGPDIGPCRRKLEFFEN